MHTPTARKRLLFMLPFALLPVTFIVPAGAGCEVAVNLDPMVIDGGAQTDVIDCGICADVSADANYDAADVTIYGIQPVDAGVDSDARDAGVDRSVRDAAPQ